MKFSNVNEKNIKETWTYEVYITSPTLSQLSLSVHMWL